MDGGLPLRELEDIIEVEFPDDGDYETVGGFLTASAGQVPPPGSVIAYRGWTFTVRSADEKRVVAVEIERGTPGSDAEGDGGGASGSSDSAPQATVAARPAGIEAAGATQRAFVRIAEET